jgi:hypothetical protein
MPPFSTLPLGPAAPATSYLPDRRKTSDLSLDACFAADCTTRRRRAEVASSGNVRSIACRDLGTEPVQRHLRTDPRELTQPPERIRDLVLEAYAASEAATVAESA